MSRKTRYTILIVLAVLLIVIAVCGAASILVLKSTFVGSGNVINEDRAVGDFQAINLATTGEIILTQGAETKLEIQAEDNIIENITTEVTDGTLVIKRRSTVFFYLTPTRPIIYILTVTNLNEIIVSGSGVVTAPRLQSQSLDINMFGSGGVNLDLFASDLDLTISGPGWAKIIGNIEDLAVTVNGSGELNSFDLRAKACTLTVNGPGSIKANCRTSLDANVNGSGEILYKGNPEVRESVSGSGRIWNSP